MKQAGVRAVRPGYMHLGVVRGLMAVVESLGANPAEMLVAAGLDPASLASPTGTISLKALGELLEVCRSRLHCPHIGLLIGARAGVASMGIVGEYMRCCDTIGEALQGIEDHLWVQNRGAICTIQRSKDIALLSFTPYDPTMSGVEMVAEGGLAVAVGAIRELIDPNWSPLEVLLPRRPPRDPAPYLDVFRAPVRYNQEIAAIVFPASMMTLPLRSADPAAKEEVLHRLACLALHGREIMLDDVRRIMRARLLDGGCDVNAVARRFGINRRTLNRHLNGTGTCFREVYDAIRFQAARHLVGDTDMPLAQISDILHFSEPPAFTRAFQRWSGGISPRHWRSTMHSDAAE
ncbi:AraC family transcriptional regulator [Prosthecomicrobium sp. N25]|uniref:AraC family transcriptional regulator n=1 Tax=Prosthecomicrobium sp. N25 TaxID=3129254 RepID=UPI0030783E36